MMDENGSGSDPFIKRSGIIVLILLVWGILSAGFLVRHSFFQRDKLLKESSRIAWREGEIPPIRGKILSSDSKVILYTELTHELLMRDSARTLKNLPLLKSKIAIEPEKQPNGVLILKRNLHPDEIALIQNEMKRIPGLFIRPVMKRICTADILAARAGRAVPVRVGNPMMRGVDGWEREFDERLRGRPGVFRVMLDRSGGWVPGTLEVIRKPEHGENVRLKWTWKELVGK